MPTYYDLVLGIIPLTFVGTVGAASAAGIATSNAAGIGALLSALFIAHAMFVNPPVDRSPSAAADQPSASSGLAETEPDQSVAFAD